LATPVGPANNLNSEWDPSGTPPISLERR